MVLGLTIMKATAYQTHDPKMTNTIQKTMNHQTATRSANKPSLIERVCTHISIRGGHACSQKKAPHHSHVPQATLPCSSTFLSSVVLPTAMSTIVSAMSMRTTTAAMPALWMVVRELLAVCTLNMLSALVVFEKACCVPTALCMHGHAHSRSFESQSIESERKNYHRIMPTVTRTKHNSALQGT